MASENVFHVTEKEFQTEVLERSRRQPVVVDFWAPWCGPCRALTPILERLIEERKGEVALAKVNIDEEQGLAMEFGISSIPMVVALRDGRPVDHFLGLLPEAQLREFLDRVGPTPAEKRAHHAADLEKSDPDEAERLYRQALKDDPNEEEAILGMVRILISRNRDDEAAEILDRLGPGSVHGAEVEKWNAILGLRKEARPLGDEATLRQRLQSDPKNAQARYELGTVLAAQGKHEEALAMLLSAAELDPKMAAAKVRPVMVKAFQVVGAQTDLANDYRNKLSLLLY